MKTYTYTTILVEEECCKCGIPFAMSQTKFNRCKQDKESFYCPNGHSMHYTKSDVQKLQEELARKNDDIRYYAKRNDELYEEKKHAERRAAAQKGQTTRLKKRIGNGVCPCCQRTFANLARHIDSKHPEFKGE